jgi:hypothetical protein|nr:MAG TPA: hypothetical protein [Caudoviricetes sp.]
MSNNSKKIPPCGNTKEKNSHIPNPVYRVSVPKIRDTGRISYSVEMVCGDGTVLRIDDVCCDLAALQKFVNDCNVYGLSETHFRDALEDFVQGYLS